MARPSTPTARRSRRYSADRRGRGCPRARTPRPALAQPRQVQLGAPAVKVVEGGDVPVGMAIREPNGHVGADESGTAGYEHAHIARRLCLPAAIGGCRCRAGCSLDCSAVRSLPTRLEGPVLIEPTVHGDDRGFFLETFRRDQLGELGIVDDFVQDNHSRSRRGVVRGMHFQPRAWPSWSAARAGAILDVIVDIRAGSPHVRPVGGVRARRRRPPSALRPGRFRPRLLRAQRDRRRHLQDLGLLRPRSSSAASPSTIPRSGSTGRGDLGADRLRARRQRAAAGADRRASFPF